MAIKKGKGGGGIKVCFCIMCDRRLIASLDRQLLCVPCKHAHVFRKAGYAVQPWSECISGEEREGNKWLSEWVQCL